jgi:uncharacterized protein YuzE
MKQAAFLLGIVFGMVICTEQVQAQEKVSVQKKQEATIASKPIQKPIKFEELPAPVQKAFKSQYGKYAPNEVYYVKEDGKEIYRVSTNAEMNTLLEIDFDASGKVIQENKKAKVEKKEIKATE